MEWREGQIFEERHFSFRMSFFGAQEDDVTVSDIMSLFRFAPSNSGTDCSGVSGETTLPMSHAVQPSVATARLAQPSPPQAVRLHFHDFGIEISRRTVRRWWAASGATVRRRGGSSTKHSEAARRYFCHLVVGGPDFGDEGLRVGRHSLRQAIPIFWRIFSYF